MQIFQLFLSIAPANYVSSEDVPSDDEAPSRRPRPLYHFGYSFKMYRLQPDVKHRIGAIEIGLTVEPIPLPQEYIITTLSNATDEGNVLEKLLERSTEEIRVVTQTVRRDFGELIYIQESKKEYIPTPFAYQETIPIVFIVRTKTVFPPLFQPLAPFNGFATTNTINTGNSEK
jgi:hypothetical protein